MTNQKTLVLIPGYMLDETLWRRFECFLPPQWDVLHAPVLGGDTIKTIAHSLAASLPARFSLVGFSLGGYVARQLAADFPQWVESLVIVASSLREDTQQQIKKKQLLLQSVTASSFRGISRQSIAKSLHPTNAANSPLISQIQAMGARLGFEALVNQTTLSRKAVPAAAIDCPTLIVASNEDPLRSLDEAAELVEAIPHSVLKIIAGSGHLLPLEQPERLASVVIDWLLHDQQ